MINYTYVYCVDQENSQIKYTGNGFVPCNGHAPCQVNNIFMEYRIQVVLSDPDTGLKRFRIRVFRRI